MLLVASACLCAFLLGSSVQHVPTQLHGAALPADSARPAVTAMAAAVAVAGSEGGHGALDTLATGEELAARFAAGYARDVSGEGGAWHGFGEEKRKHDEELRRQREHHALQLAMIGPRAMAAEEEQEGEVGKEHRKEGVLLRSQYCALDYRSVHELPWVYPFHTDVVDNLCAPGSRFEAQTPLRAKDVPHRVRRLLLHGGSGDGSGHVNDAAQGQEVHRAAPGGMIYYLPGSGSTLLCNLLLAQVRQRYCALPHLPIAACDGIAAAYTFSLLHPLGLRCLLHHLLRLLCLPAAPEPGAV